MKYLHQILKHTSFKAQDIDRERDNIAVRLQNFIQECQLQVPNLPIFLSVPSYLHFFSAALPIINISVIFFPLFSRIARQQKEEKRICEKNLE
jgi:hypothetical protein